MCHLAGTFVFLENRQPNVHTGVRVIDDPWAGSRHPHMPRRADQWPRQILIRGYNQKQRTYCGTSSSCILYLCRFRLLGGTLKQTISFDHNGNYAARAT